MSKVYIKRKGSAIVTLDDWTEGSIRSKQIMDHDYIKIQFSSIKRRTFKLGDYIETEYGRFEITDKTTINFKVNTETGGYDYTLQFDAGYIKWKNKLMKFTPENEVSELTFSLTATLTSHLELFMQNLNSLCAIDSDFLYNGELEWQISIEPTVEDNAQLIEYDGSNLLDILYTYAEKWKCECWVEGNVICFGRCEKFGDPTVFEYENNVEEITPTDSKKDFATRLYVFGGTRNLPANYRRQSAGAITNGIVQKRLMLPEGVPYLQSNDINEEVEIVEACIFLDEIYPKTDCVVDGVNTYTSTVKNEDDTETTQTFYRIGDSSGFLEKFTEDLILEGETLKVTFTSGPLNLMEFELRLVEDDEVLGKCFEIIANDNYGVFLPDSPLVPEDGDTYVVHGWDSTKIADLPLIHDAEEELLNTGKEHLASLEIDPTNYNCKMDSEWMENDGTPRFMEIGDPVELVCPNMENRVSRIIGYEFSLDMPWRDTKYIVGENAKASKFTALEEKISDVESKLTARINKGAVEIIRTYSRNTPTDNNVFSALASLAQFLNKNKPDAAKELIEFLKGLKSDSIESRKFLEGLGGFGGYGFRLGMDDLNNSHLQVDFLEVMKKAVFAELEVRKRTSIGGNLLLSGATSTIVSVEPIVENGVTTGYKCYIKTDDGTMRTQNNWVEGMQALCQSFNVEAGVYQNVENQYYWRVVTEVGQREPVMTFDPETGEHIQAVDEDGNLRWREAYVVLSNDPAYMDSGCSAPMAEDTIVHCGFNKLYYVTEIDDLDRELNNFPVQYTGVICLDSNSVSSGEIQVATSIRMFDLLTDFNFDSAIQVFGVSRAGTRINSLSFKWTSDVGELTPVIFFGDYNDWDFSKGNIPYFYEVEYGGFRWISINPNGAPEGEIPHEGSKYWKCQKTKGVTYDAYLEHDSDNITVDGDGNVVEGLWEETREGSVVSNVYKLHTAIFAQKNEEFLTLDYVDYGLWSQIDFSKIGGLPHHSLVEKDGVRYRWTNIVDAVASDVPGVSSGWERYTAPDAVGHYYIEIAPSDCYAVVKEGMLQIMAIEYVKDGVNSSGDDNWTDEQWENMRSMRRCAVNITVMMDGAQKKLLTYAVNIDHIPTQTITSDIDNQAGSLSWCESKKAYINNTGGIIRSSYKNAPISPYLAADDPTTPDHDESRYNPYVEFVNEQGVAVNVFNGTLSLVDLDESGVSYKGLKLEIAPKNPNSGTAILDGRYTAKVHFVVRVTGVYYEKVITHDILKDSKGVTFELDPSVSQIRATYNNQGALVPSVSMLGCSIILHDSEGKRDTSATDWTKYALTLKCNGENIAFGGLVQVSAEIREYEFVLYQNGEPTLDRETVPIIADGKVGEDGGDTEYIYTRTANKSVVPDLPTFEGGAATSRLVEDTVDTSGRTWTNHPQGTTTALACEWQCMRNSTTDPNTRKRVWSNNWTNIIEWHRDGDGLEYIYKYTKKNEKPSKPTQTNANKKTDAFVPNGWLDEPDSVWSDGTTKLNGCNSEYRYLWECFRKKGAGNNWEDFSDPICRNNYALDGLSIVLSRASIEVPCNAQGKPKSATSITVTATLKYGKDAPLSISASTGWSVSGFVATYAYTPNTANVLSATSQPLTITVNMKNEETETLSTSVPILPILDGDSDFILDLGNEMDTVPTKYNAQKQIVSDGAFSLTVPISVLYGTTNVKADSTVTCNNSSIASINSDKNLVISIANGSVLSAAKYSVTVTSTHSVYGTRTAEFTLVRGNAGEAVFNLVPSMSSIGFARNASGSLTPASKTLTVSIERRLSGTTENIAVGSLPTGYKVRYSFTAAATASDTEYPSEGITVENSKSQVYLALFDNNNVLLDRESIPVVCDGMHGESTFILDLGNEMDTVPTKLNTAQTIVSDGAFSLTVPIYAYLGTADIKDDTTISIDSRGGLSATQAYISNKNLVISIADGVALSSARYVVTLKGVHSGSTRTADFTLMRGIAGEAVFNIVPSVTSIAKHEDGSFTPTDVTAAVTRLQGGTATTLTTTTQFTQNGVVMAYKNSQGNIVAIDSSPSWGTSYYGDGLELYLYKGSTSGALLDKEFVPVVSDGKKGDPGTVVTGDAGANAHTVTFSPATLTIGTTDNGTLSGQVGNACPYIYPSVENGTVTSISLGTAVHCTASKENGSNVERFWISAIDYEKYYKDDGSAGSASDYAVRIPYVTGYVPITVNYTDNTTGKAGSITANFEWQVSLAVFTGTVYNTNKQAVSRFENWRTDGNKVFNNVSEVIQDAENWMVGVTGLDLTNGKTIASYINLKADSATLENYATKTYADGVSTTVKKYYSGIGIGNGKIVGVMNKFALYKSGVGVSVAAVLNDNSGTYNAYRTLYYDSTKDAWIFRGTIYADAGEFKGKVTATEGDIGCIHIDGDDYMSVKDSNGNDSVVISQRDIPSYITPFSNVQLAFNSTTVEANEEKSQTLTCNVTTEGGTNNVFSTQFYAPIANRNALSYVGVSLQAYCKITLTKQEDNLWGNTRAVFLYLVAKSGNTVVYRTSPNTIITTSNISATTYHLYYTIYDTSLKYYVEVETRGKQTTSVEVTAYASYSENKTINFLGKNGALFGYSAKKNVRIKQGEMFINGYPALALIANFKVYATGTVTSRYTASGVTVTASKGNYSSSNQKSCYSITVSGLTSGTRPMVFLDGLWVYENNNTNRYTKATLVEPEFNNSTGKLTFKVFTSENDGQRDLPFEAKILDISSFNT